MANWGPFFIVPTEVIKSYQGRVLLREYLDEQELNEELKNLGLTGRLDKVVNPWYYRKVDTKTWIKIGESSDQKNNFAVSWDTTKLANGDYEVLGMMHVFFLSGDKELALARDNIVKVAVEN